MSVVFSVSQLDAGVILAVHFFAIHPMDDNSATVYQASALRREVRRLNLINPRVNWIAVPTLPLPLSP